MVNGVKLVHIRNPWGTEKYRGPWSDNSAEMKEHLDAAKRDLNFKVANDGKFWMTASNFKTLFHSWAVALDQEWHTQQSDVQMKVRETTMTFTNPVAQDVMIGFTGWSDRMFKNKSCADSKRMVSFYFYPTTSSGSRYSTNVTTNSGSFYSAASSQAGAGWIQMKDLPAGTYKVKTGGFGNKK